MRKTYKVKQLLSEFKTNKSSLPTVNIQYPIRIMLAPWLHKYPSKQNQDPGIIDAKFCLHRPSEVGPNIRVQVGCWTFDSALWSIAHF